MIRGRLIVPLLFAAVALSGCEFNLSKSTGGPVTTVQQAPAVGGEALKKAATELNDEARQVMKDLTAAVQDKRIDSPADLKAIRAAKLDADRALDDAGQKAREAARLEEEARGSLDRSRAEVSRLRAILTGAPPVAGAAPPTPAPIIPALPKVN